MKHHISARKYRPALKTFGGKSYLARRIISCFPEHQTYVEPYAGGLSVLLNKKPNGHPEVANDLDCVLINFYECLAYNKDYFIKNINKIEYNQSSFDAVIEDGYSGPVSFLVRNRFSRGGLGKNFAWSDRLRGGQPGDVNAWETIKAELPKICDRIKNVQFSCDPAIDIIKKYTHKTTLHYLDPPYLPETRTAKQVFACEMTYKDHEDMLDTVLSSESMFVISGYDNDLYNHRLEYWSRVEFNMPNHSGQNKKKQRRIEVLWLSPNCEYKP